MLKLREGKVFTDKETTTKIYDDSYVTETGFYIGTNKIIRDVVDEKLLNLLCGQDEFVIFHLYCQFMVNRFVNSDNNDIYEYIDNYFEDDLIDFIKEYFIKEEQ